jgi:hypothetical protein
MPSPVEISELSGQLQILGSLTVVARLLRWKLASPQLANIAK